MENSVRVRCRSCRSLGLTTGRSARRVLFRDVELRMEDPGYLLTLIVCS